MARKLSTQHQYIPLNSDYLKVIYPIVSPSTDLLGFQGSPVKSGQTTQEVLEGIAGGLSPYRLSNTLGVSLSLVKSILSMLVREGYLSREGNSYALTDRGMKYLNSLTQDDVYQATSTPLYLDLKG